MEFFKKLLTAKPSAPKKQNNSTKQDHKVVREPKKLDLPSYFEQATSWAEDYNMTVTVSRNRYRVAYMVSMAIILMMTLGYVMLLPLKSVQLAILHKLQGGDSYITMVDQKAKFKVSLPQVRYDIANYVKNRIGYDPNTYMYSNELIGLLSNANTFQEYVEAQTSKNAPIKVIGHDGSISIKDINITFLTQASESVGRHKLPNIAMLIYTAVSRNNKTHTENEVKYRATISFEYGKLPTNEVDLLNNFDGFKVTSFKSSKI